MANKKQLTLLKRSIRDWNQWRRCSNSLLLRDNSGTEIDLRGANLSGANLSKADLSGANLSKADLSGANLSKADLSGANLCGVNLAGVDLSEVKLSHQTNLWQNPSRANLSKVDLSGVKLSRKNLLELDLSGVDLSGVNLSGVNLSGVDLSGVNLSGVDLSGVKLSKKNLLELDLSGVDLSGVDLSGLDLSGLDLSGLDLSGGKFYGSNLSEANLSETNLSGAKLAGVKLAKANLHDTNLYGANFLRVDLSKVDLSRANLSGAYFYGADFSNMNFSGLDLSNINLASTNLSNVNFVKTKLSGCNFARANLSRANLSRANLSGANFSEVKLSSFVLSGVNFSGANLSKANFAGLKFDNVKFAKANFSGADLSGFDLSKGKFSKANLFKANLSGVNFLQADLRHSFLGLSICVATSFKYSDLTGACIQDWNINAETDFEGVVCDYIFLKWDEENQKGIERRPSDPNRNFAPGDFERFIRQSLETVDLIFGEGIDWDTFLKSFQGLQLNSEVGELSIAGIKKNGDGSFVVQVDVPADADKAAIEKDFWSRYQPLLEAKDEQIKLLQGQLEFSQDQVNRERQNATKLTNIVEILAEKQGNIINQYGNFGIGANSGEVSGEAIVSGVYNEADQQNLQQITTEIQALLKWLETKYGTETVDEKKTVATEVIKEIEQNQSLAQRVIAAFKAGGISALDSYLDTPAASFVISAIQSWYETR